MLRDFENQAVAAVVGLERVEDLRQMPSNCTSTTAPMHLRDRRPLRFRLPFGRCGSRHGIDVLVHAVC